jgi:succinate dehydrogenase / fumarate reductase, cytochrome b subunit
MSKNSNSSFRYLQTSVGKKFLMAASGAALIGFVIAHLAGNLQIFMGQEALNRYGALLQANTELLWPMRLVLIAAVLIHIVTSIQLSAEARAARPIAYAKKDYIKASLASRTMLISGLMVFGFIIYHLLHFTFLKVHPQYSGLTDANGRHDIYSMVVLSFQQPLISLAYIVPIFFLCAHLSHGIGSMFQSLGINSLKLRPVLSSWAPRVAWLIFAGYAAIPLACFFKLIHLPPGVQP